MTVPVARAERSRVGHSRAEQGRAEQRRAGESRAEHSRGEQSRAVLQMRMVSAISPVSLCLCLYLSTTHIQAARAVLL